MRTITTIIVALFFAGQLSAQQETLFGDYLESGGYGGPFVQFGKIAGANGVFVGGQGGWIVNHKFVLGGRGYGLANEVEVENEENLKYEFGCGGVLLEYIINSNRLVHLSVQTMIGAGGITYSYKDKDFDRGISDFGEDSFFVLEPGVNVVLNINRFFRVAAGVNYRYVNGVNYRTLTDSDLSDVSGQILLKFGGF